MVRLIIAQSFSTTWADRLAALISARLLTAEEHSSKITLPAQVLLSPQQVVVLQRQRTQLTAREIECRVRETLTEQAAHLYDASQLPVWVMHHTQHSPNEPVLDAGVGHGYASVQPEAYLSLALSLARTLADQLARDWPGQLEPGLRPVRVQTSLVHTAGSSWVQAVTLTSPQMPQDSSTSVGEALVSAVQRLIPHQLLRPQTRILWTEDPLPNHPAVEIQSLLLTRPALTQCDLSWADFGLWGTPQLATLAARFVAKNLVAARLAQQVHVQLSYATGASAPAHLAVETFGTGVLPDLHLAELVGRTLNLERPALLDRFRGPPASYQGLCGRGPDGLLSAGWEQLDDRLSAQSAARLGSSQHPTMFIDYPVGSARLTSGLLTPDAAARAF